MLTTFGFGFSFFDNSLKSRITVLQNLNDQQTMSDQVVPQRYNHIYSGQQGIIFQSLLKNLTIKLWQHITDVWHAPSVYVACRGLSDVGNGPNKPNTTTIGEYSASWHHGALIFTLVGARFSESAKNLTRFLETHH